jgi:hypothetical protein
MRRQIVGCYIFIVNIVFSKKFINPLHDYVGFLQTHSRAPILFCFKIIQYMSYQADTLCPRLRSFQQCRALNPPSLPPCENSQHS